MQDASLLAAAEHRWQHMAALLAFIPTSKNLVNFRGGGSNDLGSWPKQARSEELVLSTLSNKSHIRNQVKDQAQQNKALQKVPALYKFGRVEFQPAEHWQKA